MASDAYNQMVARTKNPSPRSIDLSAEVRKQWGPDWGKDEVVYEFRNGQRKFLSTDKRSTGIYDGT